MELRVREIRKAFGKKTVLNGASFHAEGGAAVGLVGENGSGKSTLLRIMAGVLRPDGGSFSLDGEELLASRAVLSRRVGYVPQGTPLVGELSARDNLRLWYDKEEMEKSLEEGTLGELGIGDFLRTRADRLSGGMKKRLAIGCAMAKSPEVMLLDEPTAALDLAAKELVLGYFRRFTARGGILVLATHDPEELKLTSECLMLRGGVLEPYHYDGDLLRLAASLREAP